MLHELLKKHWGYDEFLPLQREAIDCVLGRRDSLVVLPTGGGKSLCYQLPALCQSGLAIVVSPLISLMKDQVDSANAMGIAAAAWNSSLSAEQQRIVRQAIRDQRLNLLYVSPERLLTDTTLELLTNSHPTFIAIDEAHCISQWGHDFRPEYRMLGTVKQRFPGVSLHGFTATATPQVRADIVASLNLDSAAVLTGNFHRPNLIYHVQQREAGLNQVCSVMERFRGQAGIVYAITRTRVERISHLLNQYGFRTRPYHAGMSDQDRARNQDALINDQLDAIVATVAFGMGIDKSNVRYVIHAELPRSLESYQQETGRAGRDGLEAECWLFYSARDYLTWRRIIEDSPLELRESGLRSLQQVMDYSTSLVCRHRVLVGHFGQQLSVECQSCDVCLGNLAVAEDSLVLAQKILSCVVRCRERFGADHITKVLTGSSEAKVLKFGHEKLSTWGLMKEYSRHQIRDWIQQLLGQRFLCSAPLSGRSDSYHVLQLTDEGRQVLRARAVPALSRPVKRQAAVTAAAIVDSWEGVEPGLFEALRELRRQLAHKASVPAYIVFSDATLRDLARRRPTEEQLLRDVHGIGQQKAATYGARVLALIREYCQRNQLETNLAAIGRVRRGEPGRAPNPSALAAFELFDQGMSIAEVSQQMQRAPSTVLDYLCEYIAARKITDPTRWVEPELAEKIAVVASYNDTGRLRPIYDALHGRVGYDAIKIVVTCTPPATRGSAPPSVPESQVECSKDW
jgi:ATP-dependent DNA helicase RecQ